MQCTLSRRHAARCVGPLISSFFFLLRAAPSPPPLHGDVDGMRGYYCTGKNVLGKSNSGSLEWETKQARRAGRRGRRRGWVWMWALFSNLPRVAPTTPAAFVCWILGLHMGTNEPHMTHLPACLPMGGGPDHGRRVNPSGYLSWAGPPLSVHVHVHVHVHGPRCPTVVTIIRL